MDGVAVVLYGVMKAVGYMVSVLVILYVIFIFVISGTMTPCGALEQRIK